MNNRNKLIRGLGRYVAVHAMRRELCFKNFETSSADHPSVVHPSKPCIFALAAVRWSIRICRGEDNVPKTFPLERFHIANLGVEVSACRCPNIPRSQGNHFHYIFRYLEVRIAQINPSLVQFTRFPSKSIELYHVYNA